jgi:hypothetical protein
MRAGPRRSSTSSSELSISPANAGATSIAHDVRLAPEVQQHGQRQPGHRVAPQLGVLIEAAMHPRLGHRRLDALLQRAPRQVENRDRNPEVILVLGNPQFQRAGFLGAPYGLT